MLNNHHVDFVHFATLAYCHIFACITPSDPVLVALYTSTCGSSCHITRWKVSWNSEGHAQKFMGVSSKNSRARAGNRTEIFWRLPVGVQVYWNCPFYGHRGLARARVKRNSRCDERTFPHVYCAHKFAAVCFACNPGGSSPSGCRDVLFWLILTCRWVSSCFPVQLANQNILHG